MLDINKFTKTLITSIGIIAVVAQLTVITAAEKPYRDENLATQLKSHQFTLNSVNVTMISDHDNDGYFSEFNVNFDADTRFISATVYAELYLSLDQGPWELYYSTDYFNIEGQSSYDDFNVRTQLTSGFESGNYDFLIDLFDGYDNSLVATISADDIYELADYFLEDMDSDKALSNNGSSNTGSGIVPTVSLGTGGAGSMGMLVLLLLLVMLFKLSKKVL